MNEAQICMILKSIFTFLSINFSSAINITANFASQETWHFGGEGLFEFPNRQFMWKEQSDFV
jgi:hypothetical protein